MSALWPYLLIDTDNFYSPIRGGPMDSSLSCLEICILFKAIRCWPLIYLPGNCASILACILWHTCWNVHFFPSMCLSVWSADHSSHNLLSLCNIRTAKSSPAFSVAEYAKETVRQNVSLVKKSKIISSIDSGIGKIWLDCHWHVYGTVVSSMLCCVLIYLAIDDSSQNAQES